MRARNRGTDPVAGSELLFGSVEPVGQPEQAEHAQHDQEDVVNFHGVFLVPTGRGFVEQDEIVPVSGYPLQGLGFVPGAP